MRLAERSMGRMLNIACAAPPKHTTANRQQDSQSNGKFPTEKQHADRPYETGYGKSPTKRSRADRPYETGYGEANEQAGSAIRYRHSCRTCVSNRVA
jgi:hypothetical protein